MDQEDDCSKWYWTDIYLTNLEDSSNPAFKNPILHVVIVFKTVLKVP